MSEEKKPRFWGMKNRQKRKKSTTRKKRKPNSAIKKLDDYQALTRKEFLKRKAGESQEDWEKRTNRRRIFGRSKTNNIQIAKDGKLKVYSRPLYGKSKEIKLSLLVRFKEKPFDFLKCYAFVLRWAAVRHKILKEDIELGYYFYDADPFTKEDFVSACIQLGTVRGVFNRFYRNGYITRFSLISRAGVVKDTEYYMLTTEFNNVIKRTYGVLSKAVTASLEYRNTKGKLNDELTEFMIKLNTDIEETINGIKNEDKILFRNEDDIPK